jgi:glucose-1-phosphate adenylyltransferase
VVSGSSVYGSVLCPNVRVHSFCHIEQCVLMPGVRVGRHAKLRRTIVDRDVLIPRGALVGYDPDEDRRRHTVSDFGIVVVASGEEPLVCPISDDALRAEAEADRGVAGQDVVVTG